ncbi:hypothetical protein QQG09_08365 [Melissococcus plutonius]|uniref:hypothetical protein n=1 Tax=Melissococcus plutonius TaxID=33970 RepID=UPI0021E5E34F|nr:hypothetical protein [Melissococcus plutonius]MCV2520392.1 hypothetical protein [Melissococcus plutonius]
MKILEIKTHLLGRTAIIPIGPYKGRCYIPTNLQNGDTALAYGSDKVTVIKKYKCSAIVEYKNGYRTVINFDYLAKVSKED